MSGTNRDFSRGYRSLPAACLSRTPELMWLTKHPLPSSWQFVFCRKLIRSGATKNEAGATFIVRECGGVKVIDSPR